jgi:lipoyl(octanoyl) transferase
MSQLPTSYFCRTSTCIYIREKWRCFKFITFRKTIEAKGATFYKINRGGDITYHGPGQIVGYPILDLENFFTDIHKYLRF